MFQQSRNLGSFLFPEMSFDANIFYFDNRPSFLLLAPALRLLWADDEIKFERATQTIRNEISELFPDQMKNKYASEIEEVISMMGNMWFCPLMINYRKTKREKKAKQEKILKLS
jgi:hypothetical protein